jgi:hypothetical protein
VRLFLIGSNNDGKAKRRLLFKTQHLFSVNWGEGSTG